MKPLRFKHVFGEEIKSKFEQVRPTTITCDSNMVKGNAKFTAFLWNAGSGGVVCILDSSKPCKLPMEYPMLQGHQGQILDLDFYPFDDNFLATSSIDNTIKLWQIPDEITESITKESQTLAGHDKKVNLIQWHPTASWVLASASHDQTVKVWDVQAGVVKYTININCTPQSLEWNFDGSLLGVTGNDKKVKVIDPRKQAVIAEWNSHQGTKPQKFSWLGGNDLFLTVGFNKTQQREYSVWSISKPNEALYTKEIDQGSGVISPFFDDYLNMLYLVGKGDSAIRYFELVDNQLHFLSIYQGGAPGKGYTFFPKRAVDVNRCEIMRAIKLEENYLTYVSFIAPRKSTQFQEDLYPDCAGLTAALSAQAWFGGETKKPKLVSLKPDEQQQGGQQQQREQVQFVQQAPQQKPQQQNNQQSMELQAQGAELLKQQEKLQVLQNKLALLTSELERVTYQSQQKDQVILNLKQELENNQQGQQQQPPTNNNDAQLLEQRVEELQNKLALLTSQLEMVNHQSHEKDQAIVKLKQELENNQQGYQQQQQPPTNNDDADEKDQVIQQLKAELAEVRQKNEELLQEMETVKAQYGQY